VGDAVLVVTGPAVVVSAPALLPAVLGSSVVAITGSARHPAADNANSNEDPGRSSRRPNTKAF
jgi:hypothetical protein